MTEHRGNHACDDCPKSLAFSVLGVAIPFTRVSPGKNGNAFESAASRHWKSQIMDAAREEIERSGWKKATGPVRASMEFVLLRRPTKTKRPKFDWPVAGKSVGDLDSYLRPVGDAMTKAGVFKDDMLIVEFMAPTRKRWAEPNESFAGVIVRVEFVA